MTQPRSARPAGRPLSLVGSLEEIGLELQALGHERHGPAYFRAIRRLRTHDRPRLPQYPGVPVGWKPAREPSGGADGAVSNEQAGERCECSPAPTDRGRSSS